MLSYVLSSVHLIEQRSLVCMVVHRPFTRRNRRLTPSPRRSSIWVKVVLVPVLANWALHSYLLLSLIVPLRSCLSRSTPRASPVR